MDNTELHYLTYDPEEIWDKMQDAYVEAGGEVLFPGDEKEMLLRAVQALFMQLFAGVDNALRMATLRYAQGEYLDVYGEKQGCERIQAKPATATVEIKFSATGAVTTLPAGTMLTADGTHMYKLTDDVVHTGYAQTTQAGITCTDTGSAGNGLMAKTQMQFVVSQSAVVSVFVIDGATGGMDMEDDETYRTRIHDWGMGIVTTGPSASYESKALASTSDVIDAKAIQEGAGKVGVYLILQQDANEDSVKRTVLEAVNPKDTRPLTDDVSISIAEKVEYTLKVQYELETGALGSGEALTEAVREYTGWQNNTIGRAFNPDRLISMLYQSGASRVVIRPESKFNGGDVKYTEITDKQRCSGTVELEVLSS